MTALVVALAGAGFGFGVVLAWKAIYPGPAPLSKVLAELESPATPTNVGDGSRTSGGGLLAERIGRAVMAVLEASGLVDTGRLTRRLRALGRPLELHAYHKLVGGIGGFLTTVVFAAVLAAGGVSVSPGLVGLTGVGLAGVGFFYPDVGLVERVERRRRAFRHALSAYLDLVTIILAGGGGLETALQSAADAGDGWAFGEIRGALRRARLTGRTPWNVFDELGTELGVDELRELAASAHLAGDRGARIRASLTAKADSMRAHQTAAAEAQAEAATEKMLLPVVALVVGMILFIGFGVVEAISTPGTVP